MGIIFTILDNPPPTLTSITTLSLIVYIQKLQLKIHDSNNDYGLKMERYRLIEYFTSTNDSGLGLTMQIISFLSHDKTGSITVLLEDKDWDEELSAKTINSIPLSDIKFPYKSYAIDASVYKWKINDKYFDLIFITIFEASQQILIYIGSNSQEGASRFSLFSLHESIDEMRKNSMFNNVPTELTFIMGRVMSTAMYMENFSHDKSRVNNSIKKVKKNKKRGIHQDKQIRIIKLKQPSYSSSVNNINGERTQNTKAFVVRGHWRNQSYVNTQKERYNKAKWIDPYVKGTGKEFFQKIVKI